MANEEHVKILMKGAAAWNQWRLENPTVIPDLGTADLRQPGRYVRNDDYETSLCRT
jgi:hypothetical protein